MGNFQCSGFADLRNLIHCRGNVESKPEVLERVSTRRLHDPTFELTTNQFVAELMDVPRPREAVVNNSGG